ncbi:MAG: AAA family ATPase [Tissierellia bacterium]|nr:AAA family ATPase [Tissierellia bacterium]
MVMKIHKLEIENVKRVKAVKIEPTAEGLTIIGGNNHQGKTSVLDAIAWALGGNKFKPSEAYREGSTVPPSLKIVMNNGLIVERKGKNSDLKVTDPAGVKYGQNLLDSFVEELALNLPKFMESNNKEKANILLQIIGVGEELNRLEREELDLYNRRHTIGQIADQKEKFAKEQEFYPEAPKEIVSASELIKQQQEILARNGENQRHRNNLKELLENQEKDKAQYDFIENQIAELQNKKANLGTLINTRAENIITAQKTVEQLKDESTEELEKNLENIEKINIKVRANLDKEKAEDDAKDYRNQYKDLTTLLEQTRQNKIDLLKGANLPLEGLLVEDGELTYQGFKWDNLSGADQLKVATAIVRKLKPECGFVLLDKLEQMDLKSLKEFGEWLKEERLQVIATRVSTGEECSLIIEDGYVQGENATEVPKWKEGEF